MTTKRCGLAAGVVDGILYAVGGRISFLQTGTLEAYDPRTDTWVAKAPMPIAVQSASATVAGGILYVVGGIKSSGVSGALQAYDPKTNTWSQVAPMLTPRFYSVAGSIDDVLYAAGGSSATQVLAVNEAFTPFLTVGIDIRPGDPSNTINGKSNGKVDVAILSSATFDATSGDPSTVTLAGAPVATQGKGTPMISFVDVNGDHRLDLVLRFEIQDLQLTKADTQAVLKGQTFGGQLIRGTDSIRIVP